MRLLLAFGKNGTGEQALYMIARDHLMTQIGNVRPCGMLAGENEERKKREENPAEKRQATLYKKKISITNV